MALFVLPDRPRSAELISQLSGIEGSVLYRHPSGNPWIAGSVGSRRVVHASNRTVDVVVVGRADARPTDLARFLKDTRTVDDLDSLARRFVEFDVLLVGRDGRSIRAQAPPFLTRAFFWADTSAGALICDDQLALARLAGFRVDPAVLVSRLSDAELSYPFSTHSVWRGVHSLGPGEYLKMTGTAAPESRTFWTPPAPTRRLAELAPELTAGLRAAVRDRVADTTVVSTDLSGGLDSTTLSFYAADSAVDHYTFFMSSAHEENNDRVWASRAARELGRSKHVVAPYQAALDSLGTPDLVTLDRFPEGPSMSSATAAAARWIAGALHGTGSTLHLNGHGGDALFGPVSTMLWSLVHSVTPGRLRRAVRHCTLNRIPIRVALTMLTHRGNLRSDLRLVASRGFVQPKHPQEEFSRWVVTPALHPAVTDGAQEEFLRLIRNDADGDVRALSADRTVHQIVQFLTVHGADVRRMNQVMGPDARLYFDSPYLDVRVVEPALALNIAERTYQYPAKPLLAAARPAGMSIDYFLREDKGEYSTEAFDEHRSQCGRIRALFEDGSELEDLGFVSRSELIRSLHAYSPDGRSLISLSYLEMAERWLRSVRDIKTAARDTTGTPC